MDKIKIARIIARLNIGGPSINVLLLSSGLNPSLFETVVIHGSLAKGEEGLEEEFDKLGIRRIKISELGRELHLWDDLIAFFKIAKALRSFSPDIVHTHTAKAGTLGRLAAVLSGVRIRVHTFHGNVFSHYFNPIVTRIFLVIERFLGIFTTRVIAISPGQKDDLVNKFKVVPADKCDVVPLGVDFDRIQASGVNTVCLKDELGIRDCLTIGIVGRLVPIKNHELFLKAASIINKRRPGTKVRYLIIGDGELRDELKKIAISMGVGDIIKFLGWRQDYATIYGGINILALTSLNEGTPLSIIEAMSFGIPVVAADVGGVADIIKYGKTGFIFPSGDAESLAGHIEKLLDDESLRKCIGLAAKEASRFYNKARLVSDIEGIYNACLSNDNLKEKTK